jgi:TonB family protein
LPAPFGQITRNCLRRDPNFRCTIADISSRLYPAKNAAAVTAAGPIPATPVPAPAPDRAPQSFSVPPRPATKPQKQVSQPPPLLGFPLSRFLFPAIAVSVVLGLLFTVSKVWNRRSNSHEPSVSTAEKIKPQSHASTKSAKMQSSPPSSPSGKSAQQHLSQSAVKTTSDKQPVEKPAASVARVASASEPAVQPNSLAGVVIPGEILDQVLPDVPQKARDTIYGKVRVSVRINVDASGNIASADLDSPGPSQYFADQALAAARRWEFAPAKVDGRNVATQWIVRFEFSQLDTQVFPKQTTP